MSTSLSSLVGYGDDEDTTGIADSVAASQEQKADSHGQETESLSLLIGYNDVSLADNTAEPQDNQISSSARQDNYESTAADEMLSETGQEQNRMELSSSKQSSLMDVDSSVAAEAQPDPIQPPPSEDAMDLIDKYENRPDYSNWGPPRPETPCDENLARKVAAYHERQRVSGQSLNGELKRSRQFNNPDILEKLIKHYQIDEIGSNFPAEVWNPRKFAGSQSFYDTLAIKQDEYYKSLSMSQANRQKVGFVGASAAARVQSGLQKYSQMGPTVPPSTRPEPSTAGSAQKRKNPPENVASDPKRPKR